VVTRNQYGEERHTIADEELEGADGELLKVEVLEDEALFCPVGE
jgi:hypothetical protein